VPEPNRNEVQAEMKRRLDGLQMQSFAELSRLPPHDSTSDASGVTYTVYLDKLAAARLQVVVQASWSFKRFLLIFKSGQVIAGGFRISPNGEIESMAERDLFDFM